MFGRTFSLALSGLLRRRRTTLLTLATLVISFAAGILSLSLMGSISRTNAEFRLNTYGGWYGAILNGKDGDVEWLSGQDWFGGVGTSVLYGEVRIPNTNVKYGVGSLDEGYTDIGRVYLDEGRWPQEDNEIAVEASLLSRLGVERVCGQEITLNITGFMGVGLTDELQYTGENAITFEVCGIIHDYSQLWELDVNRDNLPLVGAVVTASAGEAVMEICGENFISSYSNSVFSIDQYFFTVRADSDVSRVRPDTNQYIRSTRQAYEDRTASYNRLAHPDINGGDSSETTYQYLILAVTLFAVLCIYILQYPREVHTYAVFRAIGASRWKLLGLILCEMLLVCVPAAVLGGAVGAAATWAALRLSVFHGSAVRIQVVIPWGDIAHMALLWAGAAFLSRLAVFATAVRMPLTGRFRLSNSGSLWVKRFRGGLALVLGALAVFAAIYVVTYYRSAHGMIDSYSSYPPYKIRSDEGGGISREDCEMLASIPGVAAVDGLNDVPAGLTLPEKDEMEVTLYAIDETAWMDAFPFRNKAEEGAFHRGDFVFVIAPEDMAETPETCTISAYRGSVGESDLFLSVESQVKPANEPDGTQNRTLPFEPYDVICSHAFLENMLVSMEPGRRWGELRSGEEYGYRRVYLAADRNAKDLSTDISLEHLCSEMDGWSISNDRDRYQSLVLTYQQDLLLVIAVGGSAALVTGLILWSVLSLETEQERRRYSLLRALGMSLRQVRERVAKSAAVRGLASAAAGWVIYASWEIYRKFRSPVYEYEAEMSTIERLFSPLGLYPGYYIVPAVIGAVLLFALAAISKRKIMKGGADDVHDITSAGTV